MARNKDKKMRPWPAIPSARATRKKKPKLAAGVVIDLAGGDDSDEDTVDLPHKKPKAPPPE